MQKINVVYIFCWQFRKSEDVVRPKVTLQSCLEALVRQEEVQNYYSTAINGKTTVLK